MHKITVFFPLTLMVFLFLHTIPAHAEYNPTTGRFLQRDVSGVSNQVIDFSPRGTPFIAGNDQYHDSLNLYESLHSSPLIHLDPEGLRVWLDALCSLDKAVERCNEVVNKSDDLYNILIENSLFQSLIKIISSKTGESYDRTKDGVKQLMRLGYLSNAFNPGGMKGGENNCFLYTCKGGWIDFGHYWFSATAGFLGGYDNAMQWGYWMEESQAWPIDTLGIHLGDWTASAWTVEDLYSDSLGAWLGDLLRNTSIWQYPFMSDIHGNPCSGMKNQLKQLNPADMKTLEKYEHDVDLNSWLANTRWYTHENPLLMPSKWHDCVCPK